jgi:putative heme iron utilization protein
VARFQTHQQGAARLTNAEEVRTLVENSNGYGVLSTNSKQYDGYPTGSVVGFALDDAGSPFFVFSSMSAHTADVAKDGRVSLTVMANDFKGAAEGRVAMIGNVSKLGGELKAAYRDMYFKRHPGAFWIDFGDFSYWKMNNLTSLRYIGGFARAGSLTPEEYSAAEADPIAAFAAPVMKHMNEDHASSTAAIVAHEVGVPVEDALIVGLDALGMTVKATMKFASGGVTKIRVPFPQRVTDRKGIKTALVAMTQAANSD